MCEWNTEIVISYFIGAIFIVQGFVCLIMVTGEDNDADQQAYLHQGGQGLQDRL